jgi:ASC-1-like (ASCH) protein
MPYLSLEAKYFNAFLDGRKTVEGRPRDGLTGFKVKKFGEIEAGDVLEVRAGQGCARQDNHHLKAGTALYAEVMEVRVFKKWWDMLDYFGMKACLPDLDSDNLKDGVNVYKSINDNYKNAEKRDGVIGIRLRVVCPQLLNPRATLQPALVFPVRKLTNKPDLEQVGLEVANIKTSVTKTTVIKKLANPSQLTVGVVSRPLHLASDKVLSEGDLVLRIIDTNGKEYTWENAPEDPSKWARLKVWSQLEQYERRPPFSETRKRPKAVMYTTEKGVEKYVRDETPRKRHRSLSQPPSRRTCSSRK